MVRGGLLAKRCALLVAAVLCLAADPSESDAPPTLWYVDAGDTALDYRVPGPSCPSEETFRERVSDLYGFEDPFVPNGIRAHTLVRIEVSKTRAGYRGSILVVDPATSQLLRQSAEEEQASCDDLVWVLSHRMRLVISPKPTATRPAPAQDPKKDAEILRRLDALEETTGDQDATIQRLRLKITTLEEALAEEKKRKMDLNYALSVGAFLTANLTNNVGPGVWVGGELRTGPISLGLELRTVLPSSIASEPLPTYGVLDYDLSQYVALLTPCGRYSYFFGCAVAGAGAQLVYDSNFPGGAKSAVDAILQLGGRVGLEVPLGDTRFAGRAWGEVLYTTPHTFVSYNEPDTGVRHPTPRPDVSGFFGLGLVLRFGKEGM